MRAPTIGFVASDGLASSTCVTTSTTPTISRASAGAWVGIPAFLAVLASAATASTALFSAGALLIGFGGGLFGHGTLTLTMNHAPRDQAGLALGAWGAVQATAAGVSVAAAGAVRDLVSGLALHGHLGEALVSPVTGYSFVYHIEMYLLFAALVAIGPLVRSTSPRRGAGPPTRFGLANLPG